MTDESSMPDQPGSAARGPRRAARRKSAKRPARARKTRAVPGTPEELVEPQDTLFAIAQAFSVCTEFLEEGVFMPFAVSLDNDGEGEVHIPPRIAAHVESGNPADIEMPVTDADYDREVAELVASLRPIAAATRAFLLCRPGNVIDPRGRSSRAMLVMLEQPDGFRLAAAMSYELSHGALKTGDVFEHPPFPAPSFYAGPAGNGTPSVP